MDDKFVMWKRLDEGIDAFKEVEPLLKEAEVDLRWKLGDALEGAAKSLATAFQTYSATRRHIHLHGFPIPEIMQQLRGQQPGVGSGTQG